MLFLIIYFFVSCYSQCFYDSSVNNVTTISYGVTSNCTDLVGGVTDYNLYVLYYFFKEAAILYDKELIIDFLNYSNTNFNEKTFIQFGHYSYESPNLQLIKIKPNELYYLNIYTNYINNNTHFFIGCFDNNEECKEPKQSYTLSVYFNSYTVFFEKRLSFENNYLYYYKDNFKNINGYPYIYLGSIYSFKLIIDIYINEDYYNYDYFNNLSGSFYLLTTSKTKPYQYLYFIDYTTSVPYSYEFNPISICSRKDTNRYVMFNEDHTQFTNCSCWTSYNDTLITIDSEFNYPDCNYNSSMFDLFLPSLSLTYSLSDDLLEWYLIQFTTSNQSIEINDEQTLIIDELDINQDDISFNGNVYVKNLTITTLDSFFNTLDFDYITYPNVGCNIPLFKIKTTNTNLKSFGLIENYLTGDICTSLCERDGAYESSFSSHHLFSILQF